MTEHRRAIDLFLFDMAGTTIRDDGVVLDAFRAAAREGGLSPDAEWIRARMGHSKVRVFEEMLSREGRGTDEARRLADVFEMQLEHAMGRRPPVALEGAVESMNALRERGVRVGFTTGFSTRIAELLLFAMQWKSDVLLASDQVPHGRPAPDMIFEAMRRLEIPRESVRRVGVVGDTPSDLLAGSSAGCGFVIGVGHGTHSLAELRPHPHTHLLATLATLTEVVL